MDTSALAERLKGRRCTPHLIDVEFQHIRDNLTVYDAVFVGFAEALDAPLVTADGRLAAAPGHIAVIEAY